MPHIQLMLAVSHNIHFELIINYICLVYLLIPTQLIDEAINIFIDESHHPFGFLGWSIAVDLEDFFRDNNAINFT